MGKNGQNGSAAKSRALTQSGNFCPERFFLPSGAWLLFLFLSVFSFSGCISFQTERTYQQSVLDSVYPEIRLPDLTESNNIHGEFPPRIFVNTATQVSAFGSDFCLYGGRIYTKQTAETEWELLDGTGLPFPRVFREDEKPDASFILPDRIVEMNIDSDCLYVFSADGILYRYYFRKIRTEPVNTWIMDFGWPLPSVLKQGVMVSGKRGWAMGIRRKDVLWYEDIYGNQHHYGTMGLETIYFLSEDGRSVLFTDSGLPADFSHLIQGPENGRFVAENIDASGSTLFLINKSGEMYTRLIDFDTMGCDPMFFKYTYEQEEQPYTGDNYRSNFTPWALPAEPWKKQPDIPLKGQARISRFLTIMQNGHGNAARELRVAGLGRDGAPGYYVKQIDDAEWRFVRAPLSIREQDFLTPAPETDPQDTATPVVVQPAPRAEPTDFAYTGYAVKNGVNLSGIRCEVDGFSLASEGQASLRLRFAGNSTENPQETEITVHYVEAWTYLRRIAPGFDGTPRQFFVTLEFDSGALSSGNAAFDAVLQEMFAGRNKDLFSCYLEATTDYFQLVLENGEDRFVLFLTSGSHPEMNPRVVKGSALRQSDIFSLFEDNTLLLPEQPQGFSAADIPRIQDVIAKNREIAGFLEQEIDVYNFFYRNSSRSRWGYSIFDLFTTVTFLNRVDFPKIKTLTMFGSDLVKINSENFRQMADLREWIFRHLIELASVRAESYQAMLAEIGKTGGPVFPPPGIFRTFPEYFRALGIPEILAGRLQIPDLDSAAHLYFSDDMEFFAGCFLSFSAEGENIVFLVELENPLAGIAERLRSGKLPSAGNPLEIKAVLYPLTVIENAYTYAVVKELQKDGFVFVWDGENAVLRQKTGVFAEEAVLEAQALSADTEEILPPEIFRQAEILF